MKKLLILIFLASITFTKCNGQNTYFRPSGIKDRTKEFAGSNEWISLNDHESIDGYTRLGDSIYGGEIDCNIKPLQDIDIKTFKVLAGTKYARDKNHVYYPLAISCVDGEDCGVCYYSEIIINKANPISFRFLGKDYATDGSNAYFRGELINGADGQSFKVIDGPRFFYFATDTNHVYKHDQIFKDADPSTFYYDSTDTRNKVSEYIHNFIIGDKNNEWEFIPPSKITKIKKK